MTGNEDELRGNEPRKLEEPQPDTKPSDDEIGIEYGIENNMPFSVPFTDGLSWKAKQDKELREVLRGGGEMEGPTVAQLVAMRRMDGQARALYRLLILPILGGLKGASIVPEDGGEEEAEFIDQVFNLPPSQGGMTVTFSYFMRQLLQGLFDGFAPFEQVYWKASYGPLKGKVTLRKLAYRQASTITAIEDEDGHFQGFRQRAYRHGKQLDIKIPADRCFYYAAQEEERKYYGVSYFESAFYHYDKKIKMYYIAHLAAQRTAVGTRIASLPNNLTKEQRRAIAEQVANLAVAQWMTVPENVKVESLKESGSFPFLDYINHHNSQMSKSILANFFDKDSGGGSGDAKLVSFGQPGDEMFMLMLRAIMEDIATSINHYIIPRLIDFNFASGKYPKFQWAELTDDQRALVHGTFEKLASAQTTPTEFIRELEKKMAEEMGLEIDWDAVEEREAIVLEGQNALQGLGPDGKPLPKDVNGNPIIDGQAPSPEQQLADFEASVTGGQVNPEDPNKKNVKLSQEEKLMDMAENLLRLAQDGGDRIVRTDEGAKRYGVPIGEEIPKGGKGEQKKNSDITVERLLSLKAQFLEFHKAGNKKLAKEALNELRNAVADYSGSRDPKAFLETMSKLESGDITE